MAMHPTGVTVDIVGINAGNRGRNCEEHDVCGTVLTLDALVRFRVEQVLVNGREETAICVYWVTDGVDRCPVGSPTKRRRTEMESAAKEKDANVNK